MGCDKAAVERTEAMRGSWREMGAYGFGALVPDPGVAGIGERSNRCCGRHLTWESNG